MNETSHASKLLWLHRVTNLTRVGYSPSAGLDCRIILAVYIWNLYISFHLECINLKIFGYNNTNWTLSPLIIYFVATVVKALKHAQSSSILCTHNTVQKSHLFQFTFTPFTDLPPSIHEDDNSFVYVNFNSASLMQWFVSSHPLFLQ